MTELERFMKKVNKDSAGCWIWTGYRRVCSRGTHHYGWITFRGKQMNAHRAMWILKNGEIPKGSVICHKCDNPACVNPDHLFIGSQRDNVIDMISKGRNLRGTAIRKSDGKPTNAKLSDADVRAVKIMREQGYSQRKIALKLGVSQTCICKLLLGVTGYAN